MASGRFLSASVAEDERLNSLSVEAQMMYLMTIPHLDRDGLINGNPKALRGRACPLREDFIAKMPSIIDEWVASGLVIRYSTGDGTALWFKGFSKNNPLTHYHREKESSFPSPPGYIRGEKGLVAAPLMSALDTSGKSPDTSGILPEPSARVGARAPAEVRSEVEVEVEVEVEDVAAQPAAQDATPQQIVFGAICEAVGWDYRTLTKRDKGQVAQTCAALTKAGYTIDDVRHFMTDIWFHDWRWEKHQQRPTLNQLRQEIGKLRAGTPENIPRNGTGPPRQSQGEDAVDRFFSRFPPQEG